jgi:ABC-type dipeptide/oligopeptide/nickel transport system permease subunit
MTKAAPPRRAPGQLRQGWSRLRRNRSGMTGLVLIAFVVLVASIGPWLAPYAPNDQSAMLAFASRGAPTWAHPFGTDRNGYDVLTRVIYGAPTALAVGLGAMLVASLAGILIGGVAGYLGGIADEILMRLTDLFLVVPVFVMILAVVRLFDIVVVGTWLERVPFLNLTTIVLLLGLFGWPPIARLARAEFLRLKGLDFVEAARCIGARPSDILFRHILPNAMPSLAVAIALGIGGAILAESMIAFLGFGDPKAVSWGQLLYFNYQVLKVSPWAVLAPGAAIFVTVLGFNLLADGLADAFNPRLKQ